MESARLQHCYEPRPESCAEVRRDLHAFLVPTGIDDNTIADAALVVSELASNAVDHARTPYELVATLTTGSLMIELTDRSVAVPVLRPHDPTALRGRGLQLIDQLAPGWTCRHHVGGKTITARIAIASMPDTG